MPCGVLWVEAPEEVPVVAGLENMPLEKPRLGIDLGNIKEA